MSTNVSILTTSGGDVQDFSSKILGAVDHASFELDTIMITGVNGDRFTLKGNFTYSKADSTYETLTGGTVTSVSLQDNPGSKAYASMTNLTMDALEALNILMTGSPGDFFAAMGAVRFFGNSGNDTGRGSVLTDEMYGEDGDDTLAGGDGDDLIEGGGGADDLNGGSGIDTLSYANSKGKVSVNLLAETARDGHAQGDTIGSFENIVGSDHNDTLTGNNVDNIISGGLGNDRLNGGKGADTLRGFGGLDTAIYLSSNGGVTINLNTGHTSGGEAEGDTLEMIENLIGSKKNDILTGSDVANVLSGDIGNDSLDGGLNADTLKGGAGDDHLTGGQGVDTLYGGKGIDTFALFNLSASADNVGDFHAGVDKIEIDASVFGGDLVAGQLLAAGVIEVNTTGLATDKDTRFILDKDTGQLYFDSNGSGGGDIGSRLIATLHGHLGGFDSGDFIIV
jgi:Ca2+-binding RTX toxin-like protein